MPGIDSLSPDPSADSWSAAGVPADPFTVSVPFPEDDPPPPFP
jgi:hypothetical protein